MPNLHVHYYHGNVKAFRAELDGSAAASRDRENSGAYGPPAGAGSFGKSWTLGGTLAGQGRADPNERDSMGRTVLHLAASTLTQQAHSFFSILLKNQHTQINAQDHESGYTALHRALFAGNIKAARELLARSDCDTSIRDSEGMTAFELYNGTVDGTNPPHDVDGTDLYVWGVNRNFALGVGDSSDKMYPDRVNLLTQRQASENPDPAQRFYNVGVKDVVMAKLHTGVVTNEARGNLSLCGFGSNGRLGRTVHSQLALQPLPDLPHTITSLALGQDHSLALTSGGFILSWGHNRFAQLGYVIEPADKSSGGVGKDKDDLEVQVSPRRIVGPLKKEWVRGVAAGRMASACWTADSLWTWGTNAGHLGYEKAANPVQVVPRKVTGLSQPVIDVAFSDYAMVCLLATNEVVCFHHDASFRINFSTPRILQESFPYKPPHASLKPAITKVTSCGPTFAALSTIGDVYTFSLPNPLEDVSKEARDRHVTVRTQLIWALRKRFTAVRDVALGSDGTVIICTAAGHVYIRQRVKAGSGGLKFKHVPYLQRVIKVATNESGAFAAIRVNARPSPIVLVGRTLQEDLALLQPHMQRFEHQITAEDFDRALGKVKVEDDEEDEGGNSVVKDTATAMRLCTVLKRWRDSETDSLFSWSEPLLGSDVSLVVGEIAVPAHSMILSLRSPVLAQLFHGKRVPVDRIRQDKEDGSRWHVDACHPLVVLLLLQYLYTDDVAAIWDSRVARAVQAKFADLGIPHAQVKVDLRALAAVLDLKPLVIVLDSAGKTTMPSSTLPTDMRAFFDSTCATAIPGKSDVALKLADREVHCSSIILRSRCPFFEAMFADRAWTERRINPKEGTVAIDMKHLKWRPMKLVFRWIHEGDASELFDYLHQETLDEFLDFVFEVLAAATELLLDRLILICSRVIIKHCHVYNAASLACEASFFQAEALKKSIFGYITASLETMLESGLLDDMDEDTLADLARYIDAAQLKKLQVPRSQSLSKRALEKYGDWLALQDIPALRVRQPWRWKPKSPAMSPVDPSTIGSIGQSLGKKGKRRPIIPSPIHSPDVNAATGPDDIFSMDDDPSSPPMMSSGRTTPRSGRPMTPLDLSAPPAAKGGPVWRSSAVQAQKVDMRSIMAEAASTRTPVKPLAAARQVTPAGGSLTAARPAPIASSPNLTPSKGPALARSPPSSGVPSWRPVETRKTSFAALQGQQSVPLPGSSSPNARMGFASPSSATLRAGGIMNAASPSRPQATPLGVQRKSSGPAWSPATSSITPAPSAPIKSPDSKSFSLLAIQQEERDYANQAVKKPVKSLLDIQADEQNAQAAQSEEAEFLRWWEEEQARVAKEAGSAAVGGAHNGGGATRGKARGGARGRGQEPRRVPPDRGRGKGKGKADDAPSNQTSGAARKVADEVMKNDKKGADGASGSSGNTKQAAPPNPASHAPRRPKPKTPESAPPARQEPPAARMNVAAPTFNPGASSFVPLARPPAAPSRQTS